MVRILPIGDSITFGVLNSRPQEESGGYRTVLFDSLIANGFTTIDFVGTRQNGPDSLSDRDHEGYRAFRIDQIAAQVVPLLTQLLPDVVLLMAGTNDVRGNFLNTAPPTAPNAPAFAPERLANLIDQILAALPTVKILVASIPPGGGGDNPNLTTDTVTFNNAIRDTVVPPRATNVTFVDVFSAMTLNDLSPDNTHPDTGGYSKIATAWQNALLPILDPEVNPLTQALRGTPIRFEAEQMTLTGYAIQPGGNPLPDTPVISLTGNTGTATVAFNGAPGTYDVVLGYYDEDDGVAQLQVNVGNTVSQTLTLNQDVDGNPGNLATPSSRNYVRRTLAAGALLNQGATIQITGTAGGGDAAVVDYIEFIPVNDAPVLNSTLVQNLTPIEEDPTTNNGNLIANLVEGAVTDLDPNALTGIAVTAVDNTNGIWQYSTDNGTNWTAFDNPAPSAARLLAADTNTRIRFVPNPNYNGSPTGITFRAWDQTRGTVGSTIDISATNAFGGSTAFSTETATATITVNPVPDTPIATPDTATTVQNTAVSINVLGNDSDPDGNALLLASFATSSSAGGTITLNDLGNADPSDDELLYTPPSGFTGTDSFNYTVSNGSLTATATVTVTVNQDGPIIDPGAPLRLIQNPDDTLSLEGTPGTAQLRFTVAGRNTNLVNEVGVFVVDDPQGTINGIAPGTPGYLQAALGRAQVVFSVLPDGFSSANPTRQVSGFNAGERIGFYLIQNSTTDAVLAGQSASVFFGSPSFNTDGSDYLQVSALNNGGYTLAWKDQSGNQNFDNVVVEVEAIASSIPLPLGAELQGGQQQELIDLRGLLAGVVNFNYQVANEADYDNTFGLYVVEDEGGTVLDPLTGNRIAPGEAGYAQAAIQRTVLQTGEDEMGSVQLASGVLLAPYIIADGTMAEFVANNPTNQAGGQTFAYFTFLGANPDGVDHARLLGDNLFGFEDWFGGGDRDYNDIVVQFDITLA